VLKLNYSISAFCITQEHGAPFPCSLDRGDCLACFVLFHYIDFHRWFHTISEASGSPLYCQSFCVLERRYGAYFSRICSAIIPDNSTVAGDHGRILWIRCATCLACSSLSVLLLVTYTSIPYITVTMAASHVCLSSTQRILTRPLYKTTFNIILPPSLYLWSDLLYCSSLKSCMFSADGSSPRVSETQYNRLLSVSDSTHDMLMHFSQELVFLSVHTVSQDILTRFQDTGRDGYVTFVLDMDCHKATALLRKVQIKATT